MTEILNSLRMRAKRSGAHLSGAERLLNVDELESAAVAMINRALDHPRGCAEWISLKIEEIPCEQLQFSPLPDLFDNRVASWKQGRDLASSFLLDAGVAEVACRQAISFLNNGAAPNGQSMRGAMLIDAETGQRLEPDQERGVRASRMDLLPETRLHLSRELGKAGLNNAHVIEALTLAAKVIQAPGVVAELCWSDDPDYLAGYVASELGGYQRINLMKPAGEQRGGRAFFIQNQRLQLDALIHWLEYQPLMMNRLGHIHKPRSWQVD